MKCQSRSWSQRGTEVNESHHGYNPMLEANRNPNRDKVLARSNPSRTSKLIRVKTFSLGTSYHIGSVCCHVWSAASISESASITSYRENCRAAHPPKVVKSNSFFFMGYWRAIRTNRKVTRRLRYFQHVITMTINITTSYH